MQHSPAQPCRGLCLPELTLRLLPRGGTSGSPLGVEVADVAAAVATIGRAGFRRGGLGANIWFMPSPRKRAGASRCVRLALGGQSGILRGQRS